MRCMALLLALLTLSAGGFSAQAAVRERVCLNGIWKFSPGDVKQDKLAPNAAFYDLPVPSFWDRAEEFGVKPAWPKDLTRGWYRRSFQINPAWQGRRIVLRFDAVRYVCRVFVNGQPVGEHLDGFLPFEVDVTQAVQFGKPNELLVKVTNWKGLLHPSTKDVAFPLGLVVRDTQAFLAPSGVPPRMGNQAGIWQDVWLEAMPARRIERVKIETSMAKQTLNVHVRTAGEKTDMLHVRHEVLDGEKIVLTFEGTVAETKWTSARLWWPHDPYLYQLRTRLLDENGKVLDEITTRFGFREIKIDRSYVYLNGERLNLRADNYMQLGDPAGMVAFRKEYVRALFEVMKKCNINAVRLHGNPSPASTLDAADEVGMLVFDETATYGSESHFRVANPVFQKNNLQHIQDLIERDWNHPSVIAWSLANEFGAPLPHEQAMYKLAKDLDPTRIVYFDGYGGKNSDVWCGHYTWDWTRTCQLPNTAYWFGDSAWVKRTLGMSREELGKPAFIGEFYNVDTTATSQSTSVFFGPKVSTVSLAEKRNLHFYALRYVAEGARFTGLAQINPFCLLEHFWSFIVENAILTWPDPNAPGIKPTRPGPMMVNPGFVPAQMYPWTPFHQSVQFAYSPMYTYSRQYSHTFWSGQKVSRRITCFNDDLRPLAKNVRWNVTIGGKIIAKGEHPVGSKIGFYDEFDVNFTLPEVAARTEGVLNLAVEVKGDKVFENSIPLTVFPKSWKVTDNTRTIGLWHVSKTDRQSLVDLGILGQVVNEIGDLKQVGVVIVGNDAEGQDNHRDFYKALADFVKAGGCVIAIEQPDMYGLPGQLGMDGDSWSTIAFANGEHPITVGLKDEDLRFWGGDHAVSRGNLRLHELPDSAKAIIVAGSPMGLAYALLVEYRYGNGIYMVCQMPVMNKSRTEGAAGVLMRNMVNYTCKYKYNASAAAPAEPFVYRRLWQMKVPLNRVLPAVAPNRYYVNASSQTYGSDEPVLDWLPNGGFGEWKLTGIPAGINQAKIQVVVRSWDGYSPSRFRYSVSINGKPVAMQEKYQYERETFDSAQGWKIFVGTLSPVEPVKVRNGDHLRITCHQDWSTIVRVRLIGEFK
jgi:beta-galactosidase